MAIKNTFLALRDVMTIKILFLQTLHMLVTKKFVNKY